ncbi:MAG TPA: sugar-binding domain-containing protein [Candidatus Dormibacteraeota bacterium]|nr:sugar-binding domain-containing protein [Candidatus Dormibacteraeota bacterium]
MPVKRARTNVHNNGLTSMLAEVARAYYEQDLTQEQIAHEFGVSRSQISRYLTEARKTGVVQVRIVEPESRNRDLERRLKKRFPHLQQVSVASVFTDRDASIRMAVARAAALVVAQVVTANSVVCFGAGRTLAHLVQLLPPNRLRGVSVVQAMGNAGHEGLEIDYNAISQAAASAFGGRAYQINAPAILGKGASAAELESASPQLAEAIRLARSADIYVVGIGTLSMDEIYVSTGLMKESDLKALGREGAVGDICGNFFDANGRPRPGSFQDRLVGVRLEDLRRARLALACAGGEEKGAAVFGALSGRWINGLVTDEFTAKDVLDRGTR